MAPCSGTRTFSGPHTSPLLQGWGVFPMVINIVLVWIWLVCVVPLTTLVAYGHKADTEIWVDFGPAPADFLDRVTASMVFAWVAW